MALVPDPEEQAQAVDEDNLLTAVQQRLKGKGGFPPKKELVALAIRLARNPSLVPGTLCRAATPPITSSGTRARVVEFKGRIIRENLPVECTQKADSPTPETEATLSSLPECLSVQDEWLALNTSTLEELAVSGLMGPYHRIAGDELQNRRWVDYCDGIPSHCAARGCTGPLVALRAFEARRSVLHPAFRRCSAFYCRTCNKPLQLLRGDGCDDPASLIFEAETASQYWRVEKRQYAPQYMSWFSGNRPWQHWARQPGSTELTECASETSRYREAWAKENVKLMETNRKRNAERDGGKTETGFGTWALDFHQGALEFYEEFHGDAIFDDPYKFCQQCDPGDEGVPLDCRWGLIPSRCVRWGCSSCNIDLCLRCGYDERCIVVDDDSRYQAEDESCWTVLEYDLPPASETTEDKERRRKRQRQREEACIRRLDGVAAEEYRRRDIDQKRQRRMYGLYVPD